MEDRHRTARVAVLAVVLGISGADAPALCNDPRIVSSVYPRGL